MMKSNYLKALQKQEPTLTDSYIEKNAMHISVHEGEEASQSLAKEVVEGLTEVPSPNSAYDGGYNHAIRVAIELIKAKFQL